MKFPLCSSLFLLFCTSCKSQPLLTKDELKQALRTEKELDLQGGLLPAKIKDRMARFFTDSAAASSSLSSGNLLDLGLDSDAIMTGILGPENIAIHVAQNAVNFLASSLAWLAIGAFASQTSLSGRGIDPEIISAAAAAGHVSTSISGKNHIRSNNAITVPFMSREVQNSAGFLQSLPNKNFKGTFVKELPALKTPTLGDLNLKQRKEFIQQLTKRNFVASIPFDASQGQQNRRSQNNETNGDKDTKVHNVKKKLRKVVKKPPSN